MDKFVIRNPRNLQTKDEIESSGRKHLKQTTLQSLAGVVVLEDFVQAKKILESDEETIERKLDVLQGLKNKKPSKEVLIKVGIGKTVRKLSKDPGEIAETGPSQSKLRKLSYKIYQNWKNELERKVELKRNTITVQSDKETERLRSAAVKFINTSIKSNSKETNSAHRKISEEIEKEIFSQSKCMVGSEYRKLSRKVVFGLKSEDLCSKVISCDKPIPELVRGFRKSL